MINIDKFNLVISDKSFINIKVEYDKDYKLDFLLTEEQARELIEKLSKYLEK